jgi:hypothetical protein
MRKHIIMFAAVLWAMFSGFGTVALGSQYTFRACEANEYGLERIFSFLKIRSTSSYLT